MDQRSGSRQDFQKNQFPLETPKFLANSATYNSLSLLTIPYRYMQFLILTTFEEILKASQ